jgi:hypothetical protein
MGVVSRRGVAAGVGALLLVANSTTYAQLTTPQHGDREAAEALFRAGRASARAGDYQGACRRFTESFRLDPAMGTLINLGDCEEKLGHWVRALANYRQAERELSPGDERLPPLHERIAALDEKIPTLVVRIHAPLPVGARVSKDGAEFGASALDLPLKVDPGMHEIQVLVPGEPSKSLHIEVHEGESREVWLDTDRASVTPAAQAPPVSVVRKPDVASASDSSPTARRWGWISLATGSVALATGAVTGILAIHASNVVKSECDARHACSQAGLDANAAGPTYTTISTVAFGLAAAAGGVGTYLLIKNPSGGPSAGGTQLSASITSREGALFVRGEF